MSVRRCDVEQENRNGKRYLTFGPVDELIAPHSVGANVLVTFQRVLLVIHLPYMPEPVSVVRLAVNFMLRHVGIIGNHYGTVVSGLAKIDAELAFVRSRCARGNGKSDDSVLTRCLDVARRWSEIWTVLSQVLPC